MAKSNKRIKQIIGDTKGDSTISTISDTKIHAERDVTIQIGSEISSEKLKEQGFEQEINPMEKIMIKLGRILLSKLGFKGFIALFILLLGGSGGFIGYRILSISSNPLLFSGDIYLLVIAILIVAFSIALLGYGQESRCKYCKEPYLTVPVKREVTGSMKYKDGELYNIKELRVCEKCNRVSTKKYTERYIREEED